MKSIAMPVAVTLLLAGTLAAPALAGREPARIIEVQGSAEVRSRPDTGRISVGVESRDAAATAAVTANAAAMRSLMQALDTLGIGERDVQTGTLSLATDYQPVPGGGMRPSGFVASQVLDVRVRPVERLGEVLDALVAAGANQIRGIRFDVADPAPLLDEARTAAVHDARRKAELLAEAANVQVGGVLQVTELGTDAPPGPMMRAMEADAFAGIPVAVGEHAVSARVRVVFALETGAD